MHPIRDIRVKIRVIRVAFQLYQIRKENQEKEKAPDTCRALITRLVFT